MSVSVNGHDVTEITAESSSHSNTHWVDFTAHLHGGGQLEVDLFFRGQLAAKKVRIYADAIAEANKKIAALEVLNKALDKTVDRVRDAMAAE